MLRIANGYLGLGEWQRALDYDEQARTLFDEAGQRAGEAFLLLSIGSVHFRRLGDQGRALEHFERALAVSREDFKTRLRPFRGEIKSILTRGEFVAGIGNAYADEILWWAKLHPYRKKSTLTPEEVDRLYDGMRALLLDATAKVRAEMGEDIHLKPREFLAIHMKAGEPCPRCGATISLIGANQRITNFCRTCQPGGLIKGM